MEARRRNARKDIASTWARRGRSVFLRRRGLDEVKERKTLRKKKERERERKGKNTEPPVVVTCGTSSEEFIVER